VARALDSATFVDTMLSTVDTHPPADAGITLHLVVKKFVLLHVLEKAATVVSTRAEVMAALTNFQFQLTPDRLRVVGSDMERTVIATTDLVTAHTPGVAVFPVRKMLDIVKTASDADVEIIVRGRAAAITIGRATWNLKLYPGHDFPEIPEITEAVYVTVERGAFIDALAAVRYACPTKERASLMVIDVTGGRVTGCDGVRIQQATLEQLTLDLQIPLGAVDDLLKLLKGLDLAEIRVGETPGADGKLIFVFGPDQFMVNKLTARFPDVENQLLRPALENNHTLSVDREELLAAIRRVRINADTNTSAIALRLAPGRITVAARDKLGDASEALDADWSKGNRTIVVNHVFLTAMLKAYGPKSCTFKLGDDTKSRKTPLMLTDPVTGTVGVIQQMNLDWVSA
jgi:DNA polymerase III subunit beta